MRSGACSKVLWAAVAVAVIGGCRGEDGKPTEKVAPPDVANLKTAPVGTAVSAEVVREPAMIPKEGGPLLGAVKMAIVIRERPDPRSQQLGYLRVGQTLTRAEKPTAFDACQGGYYAVLPRGYVCVDEGASLDASQPLVKAKLTAPDRSKPLPYAYAFVRAIAPRYYRLPNFKEQQQYEMALDRNLRSFERLKDKWTSYEVGANDVPLDESGRVIGEAPADPPQLDEYQRFGGVAGGKIPWFFDGGRKIPNISNFAVPEYAVITNRIKRHAGVALIGAFAGDRRDFALTTDLRLIPTSKLKPGRGSAFHGVELEKGWSLPVGFVKKDEVYRYEKLSGNRWRRIKTRLAHGSSVQLSGESKGEGEKRYVETHDGDWLKSSDLAIAAKTSSLPSFAKGKHKWVDISILRQTLTLFEGEKPLFVTMVSTGKDGLGDPKTTHSTPVGTFKIREKHVTTTMDSQSLGSEFELNDVPWVQYFQSGYALHAAYWHTEYGRPRSHGCVNLSPIDAHRIFGWTEPPVPSGWHGASAGESMGEGTTVHIHP
ncbi:MAG: L,D-transpeptidase [Deltaproteobacteria bacterium]|nr:L,D-transpeptidase [Deltaproteobacteria bacterium]